MRIGIDGRLWRETGVGRYIQALVSNLGTIDKQNQYVLFLRKQEFIDVVLPNGRWSKMLADVSWHTLEEQLMMPSIYQKAQVDLLHIPYFSIPIFTRVPYIVTIHDLTISHFVTGKVTTKSWPIYQLKRLGYELVLHFGIKRARAIITVSQTTKKDLIKELHVAENKILVTHESGEIKTKNTGKRIDLPFKYLLYVGNAHPHKNLFHLLQAFQIILKKYPGMRLVCIGKIDYFYKQLIRFAQELGIMNYLHFSGEVTDRELVDWYTNAQAFIFPSLSEGFGIPGLEAMNLGCVVVASDIPTFHEIYQDAVVYFDPKDFEQMAQTIITLLGNKNKRKELITLGKTQAHKYSWKKMAEETLAIYESF